MVHLGEDRDGLGVDGVRIAGVSQGEQDKPEMGISSADLPGEDDVVGAFLLQSFQDLNSTPRRLTGLQKQFGTPIRMGWIAGRPQSGTIDLDSGQLQLAIGPSRSTFEQIGGRAEVFIGAIELIALLGIQRGLLTKRRGSADA